MEDRIELECPNCSALIDVTGSQDYGLVKCDDCGGLWECVGPELVEPE